VRLIPAPPAPLPASVDWISRSVLLRAELPARKGVFPSLYARFSEIPLARHIIPLGIA
jgi:hypothetical protein